MMVWNEAVVRSYAPFHHFLVEAVENHEISRARFEPSSFRMRVRRPEILWTMLIQPECCLLVPASHYLLLEQEIIVTDFLRVFLTNGYVEKKALSSIAVIHFA
jgi:hypothetical protein